MSGSAHWIQHRWAPPLIILRRRREARAHIVANPSRWPLRRRLVRRLHPALQHQAQSVRHPHRSPNRRLPDSRVLYLGRRRSLSRPCLLSALSPRPPHPYRAHSARLSSRFPRRHPPIRPSHGMGRLDRPRLDHLDRRFQHPDLRHAPHLGQPQSPQEAHRRERRDEWLQLLRNPQPTTHASRPASPCRQPPSHPFRICR